MGRRTEGTTPSHMRPRQLHRRGVRLPLWSPYRRDQKSAGAYGDSGLEPKLGAECGGACPNPRWNLRSSVWLRRIRRRWGKRHGATALRLCPISRIVNDGWSSAIGRSRPSRRWLWGGCGLGCWWFRSHFDSSLVAFVFGCAACSASIHRPIKPLRLNFCPIDAELTVIELASSLLGHKAAEPIGGMERHSQNPLVLKLGLCVVSVCRIAQQRLVPSETLIRLHFQHRFRWCYSLRRRLHRRRRSLNWRWFHRGSDRHSRLGDVAACGPHFDLFAFARARGILKNGRSVWASALVDGPGRRRHKT